MKAIDERMVDVTPPSLKLSDYVPFGGARDFEERKRRYYREVQLEKGGLDKKAYLNCEISHLQLVAYNSLLLLNGVLIALKGLEWIVN